MKGELSVILKIIFVVVLFTVPFIAHIAIKSMVEKRGRKIKRIESEILRTKKSINNLEKIFSEQIDYKKVEKKAKENGFDYINFNRNKVIVVEE